MAITILERLQEVEPRGKKMFSQNASLKVIYDLVRKHMAEIEEARDRGYSWPQVDKACRESWQKYGDVAADIVWWKTPTLIADCYRAVKRGTTTRNKPTKKAKPLSLKVTVEKR